ncbi:MAG: HD domain-containing phosphohydrolase [Candidatus Omnitrophota bacterium]
MKIDYKKELEIAARTMILVHEPDTLIKMIARMIVQKVKINHTGILLQDKDKDTYVLRVSRGPVGVRIPVGFARMDADNPLIRLLKENRQKKIFGGLALIYDEAKKELERNNPLEIKELLNGALHQMEIFQTVVCVPIYFMDELLAVLLLGSKRNGKKFAKAEVDFFTALASDVAMAIRNGQLFKELEAESNKKYRLLIHTIVALVAAIDAKDQYTHKHIERVRNLSLEICRKISQENKEFSDAKFLEQVSIASLLHDIGKIGTPEAILNKEGPLTESEREKIKEHPVLGATILQPIQELGDAILGVKYHHERYDGLGYPEGLKGGQIPLVAAIISVADAFDAMITDRPYRKALSKDEAAKEIYRLSGIQFDPQITDVFVELYREGKI